MTQATRIIICLLGVGLLCSALADSNPIPLIVMAAVGWVVWQVGQGFGGV